MTQYEWIFLAVLLCSIAGAVFWAIKIHPKRGGLRAYLFWLYFELFAKTKPKAAVTTYVSKEKQSFSKVESIFQC